MVNHNLGAYEQGSQDSPMMHKILPPLPGILVKSAAKNAEV